MKKFLRRAFPLFVSLVLIVSSCLIPAFAAPIVDGGFITWDGSPTSEPYFSEDKQTYIWLEFVSPSVPDITYMQEYGITVTRVLDSGSGATVTEFVLSGEGLKGVAQLDSGLYGNSTYLIFFCTEPGTTMQMDSVDVSFPRAGTYFVRKTSADGTTYRYCSSVSVSDFTFAPATPSPVPATGIYFELYDMISYYIYGPDAATTPFMELCCTVVATSACVFVFALPFLFVWLIIRKLVV